MQSRHPQARRLPRTDATVCTADESNVAIAIRLLPYGGARPNGSDPILAEFIDQTTSSVPEAGHASTNRTQFSTV